MVAGELPDMKTRPLGESGLTPAILAYGASPLGGAFGPVDEAEGDRSVHAALDCGITLFDTSPFYGGGRSEEALGRALRGVQRDRFLLSTKVGRYGPREFDFSADRVTRSVDESLRRLGLEHVEIILCHDIEYVPLDIVVDEALPALRRVQRQGKARWVGVSGYPLKVYREILARTDLDVILSYAHYNLYDTTLLSLLPLLRERGVGVINASPMGMGLLTEAGAPDWHPAPPALRGACAAAAALCRERGRSISELALQFALAEPAIATTLVGMPTEQIVRANAAWAAEPVEFELLAAVQDVLEPVRDTTWTSGLPENS